MRAIRRLSNGGEVNANGGENQLEEVTVSASDGRGLAIRQQALLDEIDAFLANGNASKYLVDKNWKQLGYSSPEEAQAAYNNRNSNFFRGLPDNTKTKLYGSGVIYPELLKYKGYNSYDDLFDSSKALDEEQRKLIDYYKKARALGLEVEKTLITGPSWDEAIFIPRFKRPSAPKEEPINLRSKGFGDTPKLKLKTPPEEEIIDLASTKSGGGVQITTNYGVKRMTKPEFAKYYKANKDKIQSYRAKRKPRR